MLAFIFIVLMSSCNEKEQLLEENESVETYDFRKDIMVYDGSNQNYIILEVASNYSDSLDAYLNACEFSLLLENDLAKIKEEYYSSREQQANEFVFKVSIPSVFVEIKDVNNIEKYVLKISQISLKSTNPWNPVPTYGMETKDDFLGVKNTGSYDLGARFNKKKHWYSSYKDVSDPNIALLYSSEKAYINENSYKLRVVFYHREWESLSTRFMTTSQSIYNQI